MPLSPSQRLASIDDLLLYRLSRLSSVAGAMVVRLCEGGYGITRREWGVVAQLYENGSLPPSALAERMHRDRARTSRTLTALGKKTVGAAHHPSQRPTQCVGGFDARWASTL